MHEWCFLSNKMHIGGHMIKIAICEDHWEVANDLEEIVNLYLKIQQLTGEVDTFYNGEDFINHSQFLSQYHLLLLDIEMPKFNGLQIAETIRDKRKYDLPIIFISGKDNYFKDLLNLQISSFIQKPYSNEDVFRALDIALGQLQLPTLFFPFSYQKKEFYIAISTILYFESSGRYIIIHTTMENHTFIGSLSDLFNILDSDIFVRINRWEIVNMNHIYKLQPDNIFLSSGDSLIISRSYKNEVLMKFSKYMRKATNA